jgi:pyruvate dehydrogenase E2 component (dihydrolipoamide acetyltransferase)
LICIITKFETGFAKHDLLGIESFMAIINPPESAILAVGAMVDTYVKLDRVMIERPMMKMILTADHRLVDEVAASKFLTEVNSTLENPYYQM